MEMAMTTMRPSPIFCPEMIAPIIDGRKTMTRRVFIPSEPPPQWAIRAVMNANGTWVWWGQNVSGSLAEWAWELNEKGPPHGDPGTVWYLREALRCSESGMVVYRQDGCPAWLDGRESQTWTWKRDTLPAMFMPAWAARRWLRVEAVRVERLQDITERDAGAEGCHWHPSPTACTEASDVAVFRKLWDRLNGRRPGCAWKDNPWTWTYQFAPCPRPERL